jgi:hypothetical protein
LEREQLMNAVRDILEQTRSISEALIAAISGADSDLADELYVKLEKTEREGRHRIDALRNHEKNHGCNSMKAL